MAPTEASFGARNCSSSVAETAEKSREDEESDKEEGADDDDDDEDEDGRGRGWGTGKGDRGGEQANTVRAVECGTSCLVWHVQHMSASPCRGKAL